VGRHIQKGGCQCQYVSFSGIGRAVGKASGTRKLKFLNWNPTYRADTLSENRGGGEVMKDLDCIPKQCCNLIVASSEFAKSLCLFLKSLSDGLNGVAEVELGREWMFEEIYPRLFFVLLQSTPK
jgi:hypothetical protein